MLFFSNIMTCNLQSWRSDMVSSNGMWPHRLVKPTNVIITTCSD